MSIRKLSAILARGPTSWEGFLSPRITWPIQIRHTRQRNKKKTENKRNFFFSSSAVVTSFVMSHFHHHLLLLLVVADGKTGATVTKSPEMIQPFLFKFLNHLVLFFKEIIIIKMCRLKEGIRSHFRHLFQIHDRKNFEKNKKQNQPNKKKPSRDGNKTKK